MPLTVGTAGHVDHGKTWLVRALTGTDTDRLPEERARGLSIDLGYAPLDLGDGMRLSLIDVPGHERFIRNMVAGATGIDLFLLVVDAAEGPRPQTHEHLAILRLLGIERGVVAVTKVDAVGADEVGRAVEAVGRLVPRAEIVAVSAATGAGLDELRSALRRAAAAPAERPRPAMPTRLYVDRSFSVVGAGTVATGTLWSGSVGAGDVLRLEPAGRDVRIRSVEVHDQRVERVEAGQRVAVGLAGVERGDVERGDVLVAPGWYPVTYRLDAVLDGPDVPPAITLHLGTAALAARVVRRGNYAQLRLSSAVVAARGDRFVLRAGTTVGGGRVLDPAPPRRFDPGRLQLLERGDAKSIVRELAQEPTTATALRARGLLTPAELEDGLAGLAQIDAWYLRPEWLEETRESVRAQLQRRLESSPLDPGLPVTELLPRAPWAPAVAEVLGLERRGSKLYLPGTGPSLGARGADAARVEAELASAGPTGARVDDHELARYLEADGRLVRLGDGLAVSATAYAEARAAAVGECERAGSIRLARFRDLLGISRRPAQLLLERLDADGVTRRVGDERVLRRTARREA